MALQAVVEDYDEIAELDFDLDGFHKQKTFKGIYAYAILLNRLIKMKKRTYPSDPDMGIDIGMYRFRDIDELVAGQLADDIRSQANKYIPAMPVSNIEVSTAKVRGDYVLYVKAVLIKRDTDVTIGYYESNGNIISTKITIKKPKLINTKGS